MSVARRHRSLGALAFGAALVVAVWIGVAVGVRLAHAGRILPRTQMAGLNIGGRTYAEARRLLETAVASGQSVTLTAARRRFVVSATEVGYRIDVAASVSRARKAGRAEIVSGLWSTVTALVAPRTVEPVARVDPARVRARVASIAQVVDRRVSDGALVADERAPGGIRAVMPQPGRALDRPRAAAKLVAALHERRSAPLVLPVAVESSASEDDVQAVAQRAREYLRTPLRVHVAERVLTLAPGRTAQILAVERIPQADPVRVRLGVNDDRVRRLVAAIANEVDRPASDASITAARRPATVVDEHGDVRWRPRRAEIGVTPSTFGRQLQRRYAASALSNAVRGGRHVLAIDVRRLQPRIMTSAARKVTSLLGTFTTRYPCCQPRVTNIRLIAKAIDGVVVLSGERFSLNAATGERTRADGYVPAPFIADGRIVESVGGGVSQFSTTLYNAAYFAGLRIDVHRPHSFYIGRYPPGREATLNYPDIDLVWTNDTSSPVLIRTDTDGTSVVVSLYGADHGRRVSAQVGQRRPIAGGDFAISVTRVLRYPTGRILREPHTTHYDQSPPPEPT